MDAFEPGDARLNSWTAKNTINGKDYYYPFKYKVRSSGDIIENNMVLRLAELYLIRAEANANLGKIPEALEDINTIRSRSQLSSLTTVTTKDECLDAIIRESRIEFFAEWGHRWFDLKRTGKADVVLGNIKPFWKSSDTLYPIPFEQIQLNPSLTQNNVLRQSGYR